MTKSDLSLISNIYESLAKFVHRHGGCSKFGLYTHSMGNLRKNSNIQVSKFKSAVDETR